MIEKFNFYDVYGYFLPGAAFLAILWIPYGVVSHRWPSSNWTGAVLVAVLAYILGHLVQSIATNAIPSWGTNGRFPSEIFLDSDNKELPDICKTNIQDLMKKQFGLELEVNKVGDATIDKVRQNAFRLARQILIQGKAVSYAEQFQGMYALTRGLVSVFALAFTYWLGFAAQAGLRGGVLLGVSIVVLAVSLLAMANLSLALLRFRPRPLIKQRIELAYAVLLVTAFLSLGYLLGGHYPVTPRQGAFLAFLSAWALIACLRAYGAYQFFAGQFASTVWRDYLAYNVSSSLSSKSDSGNK